MDRVSVSDLIARCPFEPFTIQMVDGSEYPITHPDQIMTNEVYAYVALGRSAIRLALSNINSIREGIGAK